MSVKVEFHFDFGSPNTYYCHQVLPEIEERTGVNFEYFPNLKQSMSFKEYGNSTIL